MLVGAGIWIYNIEFKGDVSASTPGISDSKGFIRINATLRSIC